LPSMVIHRTLPSFIAPVRLERVGGKATLGGCRRDCQRGTCCRTTQCPRLPWPPLPTPAMVLAWGVREGGDSFPDRVGGIGRAHGPHGDLRRLLGGAEL